MLLKKDKRIKKASRKIYWITTTLFFIVLLAFYLIITTSGFWLEQIDHFTHVKWVAVLDGQGPDMERTNYVAKLMREGKVDSVLILGRRVFKDRNNADFYVEDFMKQGDFDSNSVFLARHNDPSTLEEARTVIPWFKKRNADTVLLITGTAATKRAAKIFNTLAGGKPHFIVSGDSSYVFVPERWFSNREAKKIWAKEWAALFLSWFDLWNIDTIGVADSVYLAPIRSLTEERKVDFIDLQKMLPSVKRKIDTLSTPQAADTTATQSKDTTTAGKDTQTAATTAK